MFDPSPLLKKIAFVSLYIAAGTALGITLGVLLSGIVTWLFQHVKIIVF